MIRYFTTAVLLLFALASQAQPTNPNGTGANAPGLGGAAPGPVVGAPIDGGASLLLAGGIGYVIRKVRQRRAK